MHQNAHYASHHALPTINTRTMPSPIAQCSRASTRLLCSAWCDALQAHCSRNCMTMCFKSNCPFFFSCFHSAIPFIQTQLSGWDCQVCKMLCHLIQNSEDDGLMLVQCERRMWGKRLSQDTVKVNQPVLLDQTRHMGLPVSELASSWFMNTGLIFVPPKSFWQTPFYKV